MSNPALSKYLPGTTYKTRGRHPRLCTVTDVLTTYNLAGKVTGIRYVATHEFMGQVVTESDVCETTISMGLLKAVQPSEFSPLNQTGVTVNE